MFLAAEILIEPIELMLELIKPTVGLLLLVACLATWVHIAYQLTFTPREERAGLPLIVARGLALPAFIGLLHLVFPLAGPSDPAFSESGPAPVTPEPAALLVPDPGVAAPTDSIDGDIDGDALMPFAVVGAVLVTVVVLAWAGYHLRTRIADTAETRRGRERDWQQAQAIYLGVLDDYAAYLADPYAWLDRPALEDVRNSATAAFLDALDHAESLHLDRVPADRSRIDAFSHAARMLRTAWTDADAHARTAATRTFGATDRTRLRKATAALRTAPR